MSHFIPSAEEEEEEEGSLFSSHNYSPNKKTIEAISFRINSLRTRRPYNLLLFLLLLININVHPCAGNSLPQFILPQGQSEIVLRLKEGPSTPVGSLIYTLK